MIRNALRFIGACFLTSVFLFLFVLIWTHEIQAAFISGYNIGQKQCVKPGIFEPQTEGQAIETGFIEELR